MHRVLPFVRQINHVETDQIPCIMYRLLWQMAMGYPKNEEEKNEKNRSQHRETRDGSKYVLYIRAYNINDVEDVV